MKRLLPHLFYITLLAALGIFYWLRWRSDNQLIAVLNQPTDEAILATGHYNRELLKSICKEAKQHPSPKYVELAQMASKADSLICGAALHDSLSQLLEMMTDRSPKISKAFQNLLPSKAQTGFSLTHRLLLSQNDSLRKLWAVDLLLNYYAEQMPRDEFYSFFQPMISLTVICSSSKEPFRAEIVLCKYSTSSNLIQLSVNDRALPIKEGMAHFLHTFPKPGVYPLHVKAVSRLWEYDSLVNNEKIFYLHVNH